MILKILPTPMPRPVANWELSLATSNILLAKSVETYSILRPRPIPIPREKSELRTRKLQVIRSGMNDYTSSEIHAPPRQQSNNNTSISIADELAKFAKLREQGVITAEEFERAKKDL